MKRKAVELVESCIRLVERMRASGEIGLADQVELDRMLDELKALLDVVERARDASVWRDFALDVVERVAEALLRVMFGQR